MAPSYVGVNMVGRRGLGAARPTLQEQQKTSGSRTPGGRVTAGFQANELSPPATTREHSVDIRAVGSVRLASGQ